MKIVQIANGYLNSALYTKLFEALKRNGIDNVVFVPVQNGAKKEDKDVVIYPCFSQVDRCLYYAKQRKITAGLERVTDLSKIDVIHAHTLFSAGYTALKLKEKHNIPYIVAVRNTDVNVFFKRAVHLRKAGVKILEEADKVVFLSPSYRSAVIEAYAPQNFKKKLYEKSVVIPNGISELFLENRLEAGRADLKEPKNVKLLYVGEINRNKNLKETIDAAHILNNRGYIISITVVGNITETKCKALIEDPYVEYHNKCQQAELIGYYRKADIFVMPSHAETFGLVYAEAMSQGLPVLYTKGQGFDGYFEDGQVGYAISDRRAQDLADKIEQTIRRYSEISANCIRGAGRFNWDLISREYKEIYEKIRKESPEYGKGNKSRV